MKLAKSLLAALLVIILACTMSVSAFAYNDVADDSETKQAIEFVDKLGIITSTWDGDFKPDQYLTRADAIIAIYKIVNGKDIDPEEYIDAAAGLEFLAAGETGDVSDSSMLQYYLTWAVDNYLVSTNTENNMFKPSEAITANELMTLISKILLLASDVSYPDDYTSEVADIVGDMDAGDTPVTREQGAVALANAIVSYDGVAGEFGVYEDYDGVPLNSLAVNVFHMSSVNLVIRATTSRTLGYTVNNGVLLSNGADIDLGSDLSDYVGYGIEITYRDSDNSKTYTEDEEVLTYTVSSINTAEVPVSSLSIATGNNVSVATSTGSFNFGTSTYLYLNDGPWPVDDEKYDLVKQIPAIGKVSTISNRDGFKFKCMVAKEGDKYLATVFATEAKPGKIVGINNGYYTVKDYYYLNTDKEFKTYYVSDCIFSSTVKVGDYVTFYESADGTCYFNAGNTVTSAMFDSSVSATSGQRSYTLKDNQVVSQHAFFSYGAVNLVKDSTGAKTYNWILDDSGKGLLVTWEAVETNYAQLIVESITADDAKEVNKIKAKDLTTKKTVEFEVSFDNTMSTTKINAGDFINYSDNGAETGAVVYVRKTPSKTVAVKDMGDYFIELDSDKVYYKNQHYMGEVDGADFTSGECTLNLDMAGCVVSIDVA